MCLLPVKVFEILMTALLWVTIDFIMLIHTSSLLGEHSTQSNIDIKIYLEEGNIIQCFEDVLYKTLINGKAGQFSFNERLSQSFYINISFCAPPINNCQL